MAKALKGGKLALHEELRLKAFDNAKINKSNSWKKILFKYGNHFPNNETLVASYNIVKINRKEKQQERILVITNKALYNLKKNNEFKRRISYNIIASISIAKSNDSNEFAVHVPEEYDYRFKSNKRQEIIDTISYYYKIEQNDKLKIASKYQESLKTAIVTKDVARFETREAKLMRYKLLVSQSRSSDAEDQDTKNEPIKSLIKGSKDSGKNNISPSDFVFLKVIGRGSFGKVMLGMHIYN